MAVVLYQCDTCNRSLHKVQNPKGIEVVGGCIITSGCRGKLIQQQIKPSHSVGHGSAPVLGLADWHPRKMLFTFEQHIAQSQWRIVHNLNGIPVVNAYINLAGAATDLVEVHPELITVVDNNTIDVNFKHSYTGTAQLIMRSSTSADQTSTLKTQTTSFDRDRFVLSEAVQLSTGVLDADIYGELTFASLIDTHTAPGFDNDRPIDITLFYLSPETMVPVEIPGKIVLRPANQFPVNANASPWSGSTKILVKGRQFMLRSGNIHVNSNLNLIGVTEGAPMFFKVAADGSEKELKHEQLLLLLAKAPFFRVDKILNSFVDVADLNESNAVKSLVYHNNDMFINPSLIIKTYPAIITV